MASRAYQQEFTYNADVSFNYNGDSESILTECIKVIMMDYDYENRIMPIGYMTLAVNPSLYANMVRYQGKAKLYINIYGKKVNGYTSSINKKYISGEFDYVMTDDPNAYTNLDQVNSSDGTSYRTVRVGIINTDLNARNQKTFEGVYKNTNTASLAKNALKGTVLMQQFNHNIEISELIVPTLPTVGQFLGYLNSQYAFYTGSYTYFLDFEKTYLIANDGKYVDDRSGDYHIVSFDIRDLTDVQSVTTGMVDDRDEEAYVVFINANDASIGTTRSVSKIASNITAVNNDGTSTDASINTTQITNIDASINANYIVTSSDPNAAENLATRVEENTSLLMVTKTGMNASVFTPNKAYILSNYSDKPEYCGIYYMVAKQEIFLRVGPNMNMQETISLKKVADFHK